MKKFISFLLACCLCLGIVLCPASAVEIQTERIDRPEEEYTLADVAAARLSAYGVLDETFQTPNPGTSAAVSRLDTMQILYSLFGSKTPITSPCPFTDVPEASIPSVMWAYTTGVSHGCSDTAFGTSSITEPELAAMLLRILGYTDFEWQDAAAYARQVGLSPIGLPDGFTLGSLALYIQSALELCPKGSDAPLRQSSNIQTAQQLPFPKKVVIHPSSAEDAMAQIWEAVRYLPTRVILSPAEQFDKEELCNLKQTFSEQENMADTQSYPEELPFAPIMEYTGTLYTVLGDSSFTLRFNYSEAWRLVADLDDAFTIYVDDSLTYMADAFYKEHVRSAAEQSDYDAIMAASKVIVNMASYDWAEERSMGNYGVGERSTAHSITGFFENQTIVCDGYAKLFQYLMLRAGIDCLRVTGSTFSKDLAMELDIDHSWNKVRLDGQWYNVDLCWTDTVGTNQYILRSDQYFEHTGHWASYFCNGAYSAPDDYPLQ